MTAIERILCPVDLSEISRRALDYAILLGRTHEAAVRVVQVADAGMPPAPVEGGLYELGPEARTALTEELNWFVAPSLDSVVPTEVQLVQGGVVPGILEQAASFDADLIVIGTHGRGGFERLVLGSVTEKLLRKASCPVLAVPKGEKAVGAPVLRRILCATDFSQPARDAVRWARLLADSSAANLWLVNVVEWPFGETHGTDPVAELRRSLEAEARDNLTTLVGETGGMPPPESAVLVGKPSREITTFARAHDVDVIVMGVSGRGAIDLALLGSTTYQVLRDAPCAVLTVPHRA